MLQPTGLGKARSRGWKRYSGAYAKPRARVGGSARALLQFLVLALCVFLAAQFRLDKHIDVTIHHCLHVAGLDAGAVVFHHLIWLKHVRADLASPRNLAFLAVLPLYFGALGWGESGPAYSAHDWRRGYFYDAHRRETLTRVRRLAGDVAPTGQPLSAIALRFALSHPAVATVAVGMRTRAQLEANLAAIERGPLTAGELAALAPHAWLC